MILKNVKLANGTLVSAHGTLKFDENGHIFEPKLNKEALEALSQLNGFEIVESKGKEKASNEKEKEKKEEPKEEVKAVEEETEEPTEEKPTRKSKKAE